MVAHALLQDYLEDACPDIHITRLKAVLDVAVGLQKSQNLSLTQIGRYLDSEIDIKHRVKKVDRLEGNAHLYDELDTLYVGLSEYVFSLISQDKTVPIVVDLCFVKDDGALQMLSAEVASKGRTIPIYRQVFESGGLTERAEPFFDALAQCLPGDREVVVIMDAGFYESWFKAIELHGWHWLCRIRKGKTLKFSSENDWTTIEDFMPLIKEKAANYNDVLLTQRHQHPCRIVTQGKESKSAKSSAKKPKANSRYYSKGAKEPWILATNLPAEYKAAQVIKLYRKRMQIEESFRDMRSHQFGLCGRYIRTTNVKRWGVKMLLAAIVQIICWIVGVIGHSQGMQRIFQANTVKDRKVFSYFTLGRFIIEFNKLDQLRIDLEDLPNIMQAELARVW